MGVTAVAYMSAPLTAWLVAGGGWSIAVGIVFLYGFFKGLAANIFSTLRDVDRDADVGNYSIAVRLGPVRALKLAVAVEAATVACVFFLAIAIDRVLLGTAVTIASLALLLRSFRLTSSRQRDVSSRSERAALIWPVNLARNYAGIALVQAPVVGAAVGLITLATIRFVVPRRQRRILEGALRSELLASESKRSDGC
jgi:4-hydroxybenzoate polyprenyltransferase